MADTRERYVAVRSDLSWCLARSVQASEVPMDVHEFAERSGAGVFGELLVYGVRYGDYRW